MIPERIGTIGSTQGVKASSTPKPRKLASTSSGPPDSNRRATSKSLTCTVKPGAGAVGTPAGVAENPASWIVALLSIGT